MTPPKSPWKHPLDDRGKDHTLAEVALLLAKVAAPIAAILLAVWILC